MHPDASDPAGPEPRDVHDAPGGESMIAERERLIELYLDRALASDEATAFEARLASDEALQAALERQSHIDSALQRRFAPPDEAAVQRIMAAVRAAGANGKLSHAAGAAAASRPAPSDRAAGREVASPNGVPASLPFPVRRRFAPLAAAAGLVLAATAGVWWWMGNRGGEALDSPVVIDDGPPRNYDVGPQRDLLTIYREEVAAGFTPDWECRDNERFAEVFDDWLGSPLVIASLPHAEGTWGLSYVNSFSRRTMALLAEIEGQPVMVFVDVPGNDVPVSIPPETGLNLFRRQTEQFVMYEVTPFDEPNVLPRLQPTDWRPGTNEPPPADPPVVAEIDADASESQAPDPTEDEGG